MCIKKLKNISPVFMLLHKEKKYLLWFAYTIIFGLFNIIAGILLKQKNVWSQCIKEGQFYTFAISLCIPFCFTLFMSLLTQKKRKQLPNFIGRKIVCCSLCFILSFFCAILWAGDYKNNPIIQIITGIFSILFGFYMYSISEMENFKDITDKFDDKPYCEDEDESIQQTKNKAKQAKSDRRGNKL